MKRIAAIVAALAACSPALAIDGARLDRVAGAAGFQGVVIAGEGDSPEYRRAIGSGPAGFTYTADSVWRFASLTKQFTALLVMQEAQKGTIDLDSPVTAYWPDWKAPNAGRITIRMLLRHESGLPDPAATTAAKDGTPEFYRRTGPSSAPDASAAGFCAGPPRDRQGNGFHYNNCDYIVLGALLEKVTGTPYATLIAERIAKPLGIEGIGLFAFDAPAAAHVLGHDGKGAAEPPVNLGVYGAAGGLYGPADAIWRFDRALMEYRLLDRFQSTAMWAGEPSLGYAALGSWSFPAKLAGCAEPVQLIERRGAIGGIQSRNFIVPATRTALVLFTNTADFDFGEVWQGSGFAHDMLSAALCPAP